MQKIKRNKNIYMGRHKRKNPIKAILIILVAALLVFIGWSVAEPVMKYIKGEIKPITSSVSSKSSSGASSLSSSSASSGASSQNSTASQTGTALRGIFLPGTVLSNTASLSAAVSGAKDAGLNLVVVDLKGEDGKLNYDSTVAKAVSSSLCIPNAPDGSVAASAITSAGLTPAARICCFLDPAGSAAMRDAAVLYSGDHTSRYRDNNGNFWLNPYFQKAQQYIISLATEAVSLGYKTIILDDVEFTSSGNTDKYAWFGTSAVSKEDELRAFVAAVTSKVNAAGGKVVVRFPATSAMGGAIAHSGQDQNMYAMSSDMVAPDFLPSGLDKASVKIGSKTILSPDLTPSDTVSALAQYAATQITSGSSSNVLPFVQAFTDTALGKGYYKNYTTSDINAEIAAVKAAGFSNFILYNPKGTYDFSGLSVK
ncbi:MAG: putative glycoside hydrolase [Clostridia bacterium]|nr:putative glycoside hydrolase [Clostridia bacterium]